MTPTRVRLRTLCGCEREMEIALTESITVPYRDTSLAQGATADTMWPAFSHDPATARRLRAEHEHRAFGPMRERVFRLSGRDRDGVPLYIEVTK